MKNSVFILFLIVFKTLWLSSGDAKAIYLTSSPPPSGPKQSTNEFISPIVVTEEVYSTRVQHIPRATDQPSQGAKEIRIPTMPPSLQTKRNNSTESGAQNGVDKKTNSTGPTHDSVSVTSAVVSHIPRKRHIVYEATMPYNFFTLHQPCEFDTSFDNLHRQTDHCQWMYNVRFLSEGYYRNFMLYRAEAFFFGQYHERLRRYELDAHIYAYPIAD